MADTIVASPGSRDFNVQSLSVQGNSVSVSLTRPGFASYNQEQQYVGDVYLTFYNFGDPVPILDETTGVTYNLSDTSNIMLSVAPDGSELVTFSISGIDPPFQGTLTGQNPCFATDTLIAVPYGTMAVQDLRPGDIVTTLAGPATVTWIGHRRARDTEVIRIRAGTLRATRDLIVSEDHALYVAGCLVPAGLLVDGDGIVRERRAEVTFWHVELAQHAILLAEGVEAESYLDTGNRRQFGNCPLAYDPVQAVQDPCAEVVLAGRRLEEIRAMLRDPALA